jgi:DNA repair protein RecO (recombination protein O)
LLLQTIDLHERDRIVVFLSRDWGLKRGAARSARARFSRFGGELQQLAKVHLSWFEKPDRDLVRLADAEMIRSPGALHTDLEGILVSSYLAEHMQVFAQEHEPDNHLYRLLDSTVQALIAGCDRSLAARYLECWTLRLSGVFPAPRHCPSCGAALGDEAVLALDAAGLLCPACGAGAGATRRISEPALSFLRRIGAADLPGLQENGGVEESTLKSVEAVAREVRRAFLGKELRSYGVMQRTLRDVAP